MSRRLVAIVGVALVAAIALPAALAFALVDEPGGSGVVEGTIWVANEGSDRLTGIDADTHTVVTVFPGIAAPHNVQVSPDGRTIWATSTTGGLVAAIDQADGTVHGAIEVGELPAHVIVTPDGDRALVAVSGENTVAVVGTATMELQQRLPVGAYPHGLRPSPDGRTALVANMGESTVTLLDLEAMRPAGELEVGEAPVQVAYAPDGRYAYVSLNAAGEVAKIDLEAWRVVDRVTVDAGPVQVAVTPDGQTLLVACQGTAEKPGDTLVFVDTATMVVSGVLTVGSGAHGVAIDPSGRQAFVTTTLAGDVVIVDLAGRVVVDRVQVGGQPNGISFSQVPAAHAREAEVFERPLEVVLPLGGSVDGGGSGSGHHH